jgi:hypothetical protein
MTTFTHTRYCGAEFEGGVELPRTQREALHTFLREQGMSTRAISAVTGVDPQTVTNDVHHQLPNLSAVGLPPTLGRDGKTRKAPERVTPVEVMYRNDGQRHPQEVIQRTTRRGPAPPWPPRRSSAGANAASAS